MSTVLSVKLPDILAKELRIFLITEKYKSFFVQKAFESYLGDKADLQVSLDRLRDTSDSIISIEEMRKEIGL
ncbi:MAG: hypothetical protein KAQ93_04590 [Spirochaetales bacterium]|nr:hypothetical protein [Spirochaetales bacterium]